MWIHSLIVATNPSSAWFQGENAMKKAFVNNVSERNAQGHDDEMTAQSVFAVNSCRFPFERGIRVMQP
jgi:hypothetical protein